MRNRNRRWLLAWTFASLFPHIMLYEIIAENDHKNNSSSPNEMRGVFAPRMDYEQWTPLGRGDPLKHDPTYDYVPPVLDRVHYWIDPASRKPDAPVPGETQKTEILVLGVSSKKPSTGTSAVADSRRDGYDPFLKFVEGPKFQNNYQRMSRPHYSMSSSYYPSISFPNKNKQTDFISDKSDQRVPYTVLMPPPIPGKTSSGSDVVTFQQTFNSITSTTERPIATKTTTVGTSALTQDASSVTIQQSNLLYHSSTLGSQDEFREKHNHFGTLGASSSQVTWRTPLANPPEPTMEFVKVHQVQRLNTQTNNEHQRIPASIPTPTMRNNSQIMHKGHVTDGDLDISNIYVNIGKPEAQMHSPNDMEISSVSMEPPQIPMMMLPSTLPNLMKMQTNTIHPEHRNPTSMMSKPQTPTTLQTLHTMQTMESFPSSFSTKPTNSLHSLLQKEITSTNSKLIPTPSIASMFPSSAAPITSEVTNEIIMTSTIPPPTMTTATLLTTDPLFKHYKQPTEPLKGPMYLIIQGHSKVKTYGPGKQIHGIAVQETNEIPTSEEKDDEYIVKHLHNYKKENNHQGRLRQGKSSKLQTLSHVVKAGLGAIEFSEIPSNRRKDDNVQEAELVVKYDVSSQVDSTSEVYHKGIVEAGDIARNIKNS